MSSLNATRVAGTALFWLLLPLAGLAQQLSYGTGFTESGNLQEKSTSFVSTGPDQVLAVKLTVNGFIPSDTLFLIVKDINGVAGRFYMKKSGRNPQEANGLVQLDHSGIYRLYVYNPRQRRRPMALGTLYLTDETASTPEALQQQQKQVLASAGRLGRSTRAPAPPPPAQPARTSEATALAQGPAPSKPKPGPATTQAKEELDAVAEDNMPDESLDATMANDPFAGMDAIDAEMLDEDFDATLEAGMDMEMDILQDLSGIGMDDFDGEFEDLEGLEEEMNFDLDEY